jgi:hypothetical protein
MSPNPDDAGGRLTPHAEAPNGRQSQSITKSRDFYADRTRVAIAGG